MAARVLRTNTYGADVFRGSNGAELIYGWDPNTPASPLKVSAFRVATGFSQPVFVTAPSNDADRVFIVEKTGLIKVLSRSTGQINATPFLDVTSQITTDGEQGVLGLAFHPDFSQNRKAYVYMSTADGDVEIREYQTSTSSPDTLEPSTARLVLRIDFSSATNHRGGWIGFGPDGYLYAGVGDSASSGNAQAVTSLLGKILRLDVNGSDAYPSDPSRNYAIPAGNPTQFDGIAGNFDPSAVYAIGLRNPWRESFDLSGRLFIGDVGERNVEEINLGRAGANYGWGRGTSQDDGPITPADPRYTNPIHAYEHGSRSGSVTGGYFYNGPIAVLQGQYVFGDFVRGTIFTLQQEGQQWQATDRSAQVIPNAGSIDNISSFGQDASANLYVVDFDGDIYRFDPVEQLTDQGDRLFGNGGADVILGGDGNDVIGGGAGPDRLDGGNGDDQLDGGSANDTLRGGNGNDTLKDGSGNDHVEGGNGDDRLSASNGNDRLRGDAGNDRLSGGSGGDLIDGGAGRDILIGGPGMDTLIGGASVDLFEFRDTPGLGSVDSIRGYSLVSDTIVLDNVVFRGLPEGILGTGAFRIGATARDRNDRIIYDKGAGALYFDSDGSGDGASPVEFATLTGRPDLTRFDFLII